MHRAESVGQLLQRLAVVGIAACCLCLMGCFFSFCPPPVPALLHLYIVDSGTQNVFKASLDGEDVQELSGLHEFTAEGYPQGIAVSAIQRKLYVVCNDGIIISNLDGTSAVLDSRAWPSMAIALDEIHGKIYVTTGNLYEEDEFPRRHVSCGNLDGSGGVQDLGEFNVVLNEVYAIALDIERNRLYVTGSDTGRVATAELDGSNGSELSALNGLVGSVKGVAVDPIAGRIYITGDNSTIVVSDLDGGNAVSLGNLGGLLDHPYGIALDPTHGRMYIANAGGNNIVRANLDGTDAVALPVGPLDSPWYIAIGP
jgi:DNA-binding beta-propeller fold protein YncE